jgi:hypothetical protein
MSNTPSGTKCNGDAINYSKGSIIDCSCSPDTSSIKYIISNNTPTATDVSETFTKKKSGYGTYDPLLQNCINDSKLYIVNDNKMCISNDNNTYTGGSEFKYWCTKK